MSTLQIYEMVAKATDESKSHYTTKVVDETPDAVNIVNINGVITIIDSDNDSTISLDDMVKDLNELYEYMWVKNGKSEKAVRTAISFFDQLKDESDSE